MNVGEAGEASNLFSVTVPVLDLRLLDRELAGLHGYVLLEGACEAGVAHVLGRHPGNVVGGAYGCGQERLEVEFEAVLAGSSLRAGNRVSCTDMPGECGKRLTKGDFA